MKYLFSSFSILHRQSDILLTKQLNDLGLSSQQFVLIMCLCEQPGISQEQLSSIFRVDKGSVAKTIHQLSDLGYVTRELSETDKRQYKLLPTPKATGVYQRLYEIITEYERYLTRNLTPIETDILRSLLDKLTENI